MEEQPKFEQPIIKKETEIETVSIEQAKEILGEENMFGPDKADVILKALGRSIEEVDVPEIQFAEKELQMMADNNEHLELEVPDLTMEDIQNAIKEEADTDAMRRTGGLRRLNSDIEAKYFNTDKTMLQWKAVSSSSEIAINQTAPMQLKTLINTLEERYGGELPNKYKAAAEKFRNEFAGKLNEAGINIGSETDDKKIDDIIYNKIGKDEQRKKLVSWLENSEIAKLLTPTITEASYDFALRYLSAKTDSEKARVADDSQNDTRIYQSASADGLTLFGNLQSNGVHAADWRPVYRNSDCGLSFSRS